MKQALLFPLLLLIWLGALAQTQPSSQEQQLVDELNRSRRDAGLPELKVDPKLTQAARKHSQRMADQRKLTHVLPGEESVAQRLAAAGVNFNRSGENVGYNTDFDGLHPAWMKSPGHRKNILQPAYNSVGIGVVRGSDGIYWATQDFASEIQQRSADQAEDLVARKFSQWRSEAGAPPLERVHSDKLHDLACTMGKAGRLRPQEVLALPGVHYAVTYSNSSPDDLPSSARDLADEKRLERYAVGACFVREKNNPGGTYYVAIGFY